MGKSNTQKKIEEIAYKRILELVPSEVEVDVPGEFSRIEKIDTNLWEAEYRIPLVEFSPKGIKTVFEVITLQINKQGKIISEIISALDN